VEGNDTSVNKENEPNSVPQAGEALGNDQALRSGKMIMYSMDDQEGCSFVGACARDLAKTPHAKRTDPNKEMVELARQVEQVAKAKLERMTNLANQDENSAESRDGLRIYERTAKYYESMIKDYERNIEKEKKRSRKKTLIYRIPLIGKPIRNFEHAIKIAEHEMRLFSSAQIQAKEFLRHMSDIVRTEKVRITDFADHEGIERSTRTGIFRFRKSGEALILNGFARYLEELGNDERKQARNACDALLPKSARILAQKRILRECTRKYFFDIGTQYAHEIAQNAKAIYQLSKENRLEGIRTNYDRLLVPAMNHSWEKRLPKGVRLLVGMEIVGECIECNDRETLGLISGGITLRDGQYRRNKKAKFEAAKAHLPSLVRISADFALEHNRLPNRKEIVEKMGVTWAIRHQWSLNKAHNMDDFKAERSVALQKIRQMVRLQGKTAAVG
jgi:hypothetical protein